jgi:hypothetical protein
MGDLIVRQPANCSPLWEASQDEDLWAVIACPNENRRNSGFALLTSQKCKGMVSEKLKRVTDLLGDPLDLTDTKDVDHGGPEAKGSVSHGPTDRKPPG